MGVAEGRKILKEAMKGKVAGPWQPLANVEEIDVMDSSQEESQETHACEVIVLNTADFTINLTETIAGAWVHQEAGRRGGEKPNLGQWVQLQKGSQ